jgi:ribosome-associated protein
MLPIVVRPDVVLGIDFLEVARVRSSGPGGQNVNKVSSKVMLSFNFEECTALPPGAKSRLRRKFARRLDSKGRLVIISQVSRDQSQNLRDARERLAVIVGDALVVPKRRVSTTPSRGAVERRLATKRHRSGTKEKRRCRDSGTE